eukprot:62454-Rhodomonas_salina.1
MIRVNNLQSGRGLCPAQFSLESHRRPRPRQAGDCQCHGVKIVVSVASERPEGLSHTSGWAITPGRSDHDHGMMEPGRPRHCWGE